MKNINDLHTTGKSSRNIQSKKTKGFGYQVLGFGSGGAAAAFICAEGGTVITCGSFKTHVFTGPGSFVVNSTAADGVEYLTVAGGGGGGDFAPGGGGGGAGGYRTNYDGTKLAVTAQTYPIAVGGGGAVTSNGNDSTFSSITSTAGGGGSFQNEDGLPGGSGGGGGSSGDRWPHAGGTGNTPPTDPPQGKDGGTGYYSPAPCCGPTIKYRSAGGGGASAVGANGPAGPGGDGSPISPTMIGSPAATCYGTPGPASGRWFSGGGGGTQFQPAGGSGSGGAGGGGGLGTAGTVNTGGGGGSGRVGTTAGVGGSGIVMIRYKFE